MPISAAPWKKDDYPFGLFPAALLVLSVGYYLLFFILSGALQHPTLWAPPGPGLVYGYFATPIGADAFRLVWMGIAALIIGWFLGGAVVRRIPARNFICERYRTAKLSLIAPGREILFFLCALNIAAVSAFYWFEWRPQVFYQLAHSAFFFSLAVVHHGQIAQSPSKMGRWFGYGALALFFLAFLAQRQTTLLFMAILFLGLLEILHRRRKWILMGSLLFILLALLYPLKRTPLSPSVFAACLPKIELEEDRTNSYLLPALARCESTAARRNLIAAAVTWSRDQALRRISAIRLLDRAMAETPTRVPYFNGETLRPLLYMPVPRFLWPEKPLENIGNRIGHAYRILSPDDSATSINLPWIVEFYINFGTKGVIAGFALAGFALGGLARLGTVETRSPTAASFTIGILFPLAYQESNLSLMVGNALHGAAGAAGLIALAWVAGRVRANADGTP